MSIGSLDAATAYNRVLGLGSMPKPAALKESAPGAGSGFGGMVEAMITDTAQHLRAAEQASARQVAGKGDLIDVVTAIGSAETALDTMVAVRDRVVNAYSDIMRMQI